MKNFRPSDVGDSVRGGDGYENFEAAFIYIDISPFLVRDLMLTKQATVPNLNVERLSAINTLKEKIQEFKMS